MPLPSPELKRGLPTVDTPLKEFVVSKSTTTRVPLRTERLDCSVFDILSQTHRSLTSVHIQLYQEMSESPTTIISRLLISGTNHTLERLEVTSPYGWTLTEGHPHILKQLADFPELKYFATSDSDALTGVLSPPKGVSTIRHLRVKEAVAVSSTERTARLERWLAVLSDPSRWPGLDTVELSSESDTDLYKDNPRFPTVVAAGQARKSKVGCGEVTVRSAKHYDYNVLPESEFFCTSVNIAKASQSGLI